MRNDLDTGIVFYFYLDIFIFEEYPDAFLPEFIVTTYALI